MKDLIWMSNTKKFLRSLPKIVKVAVGHELHRLQSGCDPSDWKSLTTIGSGVREIRIRVDGEHRVIYYAAFKEGIYILHIFQKKTTKTSQKDLNLAASRMRQILRERG